MDDLKDGYGEIKENRADDLKKNWSKEERRRKKT